MEVFIYIMLGMALIVLGVLIFSVYKEKQIKRTIKQRQEDKLQAEMDGIKEDINTTEQ